MHTMANMQMTPEKLEALRSEYKFRNVRGKYPRQKMLPEYQSIYPWVMPDEVDPYFAFCILCECRLSAKRSDLGKHEGSIKHTQNTSEKGGILLKGTNALKIKTTRMASLSQGEDDEEATGEDETEEDNDAAEHRVDEFKTFIKQEPIIDSIETSNAEPKLEDSNKGKLEDKTENKEDSVENGDSDDDDEEDDEGDDDDSDVSYVPPKKRRAAKVDSDSQHSGTLEYVPVHVTINDGSTNPTQLFSLREIASSNFIGAATPTQPLPSHNLVHHHNTTMPSPIHYPMAPSTTLAPTASQTPCKITIKKITAPLAPVIPTQVTSTATITPVPASIKITQQQTAAVIATQPPTQQLPPTSLQSHSTGAAASTATMSLSTPVGQITPVVVRDSFDLFFDSICATVKTLPPKLATEGKIRVMQLIGELEMRAIVEREAAATTGRIVGQQVVASTTK